MIRFSYFKGKDREFNLRCQAHEITYAEAKHIAEYKWSAIEPAKYRPKKRELLAFMRPFVDNYDDLAALPLKTGELNVCSVHMVMLAAVREFLPDTIPVKLKWEVEGKSYTLNYDRINILDKDFSKLSLGEATWRTKVRESMMDNYYSLDLARQLFQPEGMPDPANHITWKDYIVFQHFTLRAMVISEQLEKANIKPRWIRWLAQQYLLRVK